MTFTSTVDTVISSINADIATLESLLGQTESETLQSINLDIFPAPLFDDATQTWTLYQNTPDANGVYEGQYTLAWTDPALTDSKFVTGEALLKIGRAEIAE